MADVYRVISGGDDPLSEFTARKLVTVEPKRCWRNAALAVLTQRTHRDNLYCEGYAWGAYGIVLAHGWIETPDGGFVYDPTWWSLMGTVTDSTYMAVHRYTRADLEAIMDRNGGNIPMPVTPDHKYPAEARAQAWAAAGVNLEAFNGKGA